MANHQILPHGSKQYQDMTRAMGGDGEGYNFDPVVISGTQQPGNPPPVTRNKNPSYITSSQRAYIHDPAFSNLAKPPTHNRGVYSYQGGSADFTPVQIPPQQNAQSDTPVIFKDMM